MPLYDFHCAECDLDIEKMQKLADMTEFIPCPECGKRAYKILPLGHGGPRRPDAAWLNTVGKALADDDGPGPQFKNVQEYRAWLRAHPNIHPKDSHPVHDKIGIEYGLKPDPITDEERQEGMAKQAQALLQERRAIRVY